MLYPMVRSINQDDNDGFSISGDSKGAPSDSMGSDAIHQTTTAEEELRSLIAHAYHFDIPELAKFLSEKLHFMTGDLEDLYQLAHCYYRFQEYERALEVLNTDGLLNTAVKHRYLAGLCSIALGKAEDALAYLGENNPFRDEKESQDSYTTDEKLLAAAMCLARGKAFLLVPDEAKAKNCFREALMIDVKCYDALLCLIQNNMLDEKEEESFLKSLPYGEESPALSTFMRYMYQLKLNRQTEQSVPTEIKIFENCLDVKLNKAMALYHADNIEECYAVCEDLRQQDPYFKEAIPLRLDCLYKLKKKTELYHYAKYLVDKMNQSEVAWHAVGLYYLFVKNYQEAETFFRKALEVNRLFQQSWLGLGHALSAVHNYEEAIDAYETCSTLVPSSHLPLMYLAEQHMERNDLIKAGEYFRRSLEKCDDNPYLYERYGFWFLKMNRYNEGRVELHKALYLANKLRTADDRLWERIWCDLGNVYYHSLYQNYESALRCCRNALLRNPRSAEAHTIMGKSYYLQGEYTKAIFAYYEALRYTDKESLEIQQMLDKALKKHAKLSPLNNTTPKPTATLFLKIDNDIVNNAVEIELATSRFNENED